MSMTGMAGRLYSTLSMALSGEIDYASARYTSDRYKPSVSDILTVKAIIHKKSALPYELVDAIVDFAEYWPHTTTSISQPVKVPGARPNLENEFLLRSYPLGCPQQVNDFVHGEYQISHGHTKSNMKLPSQPWPPSQHIPNDATQEIISKWTSRTLPRFEHPCRKIVFTIKSHDQGYGGSWGHQGTYQGSYTWFDVGLERMSATRENLVTERPDLAPAPQCEFGGNGKTYEKWPSSNSSPKPVICSLRTIVPATPQELGKESSTTFHHDLLPSTMALQRNATATRESREHKITWSFDDNVVADSVEAAELDKQGRGSDTGNGEFVRNLKVGDVVTVWAKARFPQWLNVVEEVKMDVYWAV